MLDLFYVIFLFLLLSYFVASERKEVPFVVIVHALVQYFLTQFFWLNQVTGKMGGLLLLFIILTSVILIWGRHLPYGKELQMVKVFFRVSAWGVFLMAILVAWVKGTYILVQPYTEVGAHYQVGGWEVHPFIKLCGNGSAFIVVLLLIFGWGRNWTLRDSLADFLPFILFCCWMLVLVLLHHPPTGVIVCNDRFAIPFTSPYF